MHCRSVVFVLGYVVLSDVARVVVVVIPLQGGGRGPVTKTVAVSGQDPERDT